MTERNQEMISRLNYRTGIQVFLVATAIFVGQARAAFLFGPAGNTFIGDRPDTVATGDLDGVVQRLPNRKRGVPHPFSERVALEQLGDHVGRVLVSAGVVDRKDVGVIQGPGRPGLLLEAVEQVGIVGDLLGQHLQGHIALQPGIPGTVNLTHPPGPEGLEDLVGAEACSRRQRHAARLPAQRKFSTSISSEVPKDPSL